MLLLLSLAEGDSAELFGQRATAMPMRNPRFL
jgi:hypothetical protein